MSVPSGTTSSGSRANRTGTQLEHFVHDALIRAGFALFENHKPLLFENRHLIGGKQFQPHVNVGTTIYQSTRIVDFLITNKARFAEGLIIECKWQQSSGSVDEKYPFLLCNIIKTGVPTIVLLDGGGYKPAAKTWLQNQITATRALLGVWDMAAFQRHLNDGFLG
ncbi:MAG: PD-(D/E)XK nuclease superfamily protein [Pseudomonadales bacterium]